MTGYGQPAPPRAAAPGRQPQQTTQIIGYVAAGLGVLMFIWGFLKWFTEGSGDGKAKLGGYAVNSPATGAIACVLAAGLLVLVHTLDKKPIGLVPLALSASGLLLTIGTFIGKGSISVGSSSEHIGAGIGLILGLITAILQTGALGYLHFGLGSGAATTTAGGAATWQPSSTGYGAAPTAGGQPSYGQQPAGGSPYGSPSASPGGQPSYGQYGSPQQQPQPQPQRPPAAPYGPPSQQPTQHMPAGGPPSSPPPPSGPPAGNQPPAPSGPPPGQYGPPSQYGQPGQNPPGQNPYGPPQQR